MIGFSDCAEYILCIQQVIEGHDLYTRNTGYLCVDDNSPNRLCMAKLTENAYDFVTEYGKKCYRGESVDLELSNHGIELISLGFGRAVYSLPGHYVSGEGSSNSYVVKLPEESMHKTADGLEQNRREIEAWEDTLKNYRDYLVPIIDYHPDNWWIVMPRVETIDIDSPVGQERKKELKDAGFEFKDEVELGNYDGELLLLDYGYEIEMTD